MIIQPMNTETLPATSLPTLNGVARLDHLGVIQIEGEDAAKFIHGQLTHDFALLDLNSARLAAFCSAKGRMQASFIAFKRPAGDILLVCSKDLLAPTLKRLSMFVMRAKARLTDASERFAVYGLAGSAIKEIAAGAQSVWAKADFGTETVVKLYPADCTPRQLWVAPVEAAAPPGPVLPHETWLWSEVRSGIATVSQPVFEAFVPQMLNYESVDGVNFKKGCYPGQEVVARSQFRGTLKRRAFVVRATGPLLAGQEIFAPGDDTQPVGTVVQAAHSPQGDVQAIVSLQLSALPTGGLHVGAVNLEVLPLPYPLLEDI